MPKTKELLDALEKAKNKESICRAILEAAENEVYDAEVNYESAVQKRKDAQADLDRTPTVTT